VREDFRTKARRLLAEGRVTIRRVGFASAEYASVIAVVRGDSAEVYTVTYAPRGGRAPVRPDRAAAMRRRSCCAPCRPLPSLRSGRPRELG
jgi:hypothetical protein